MLRPAAGSTLLHWLRVVTDPCANNSSPTFEFLATGRVLTHPYASMDNAVATAVEVSRASSMSGLGQTSHALLTHLHMQHHMDYTVSLTFRLTAEQREGVTCNMLKQNNRTRRGLYHEAAKRQKPCFLPTEPGRTSSPFQLLKLLTHVLGPKYNIIFPNSIV